MGFSFSDGTVRRYGAGTVRIAFAGHDALQQLFSPHVESKYGKCSIEARPHPAQEGEGGSALEKVCPSRRWQGLKLHLLFKGTVSRDFLLLVFFANHIPPSL
jgi:hypothetical protein